MTLLNWQRSIEQVALINKRCRLLGFTSARRGAGVSLTCRLVAKTMAVSGAKTLIVTLSERNANSSWSVGDKPMAASALRESIVPSVRGFDLLSGRDAEGRPIAANVVQLRERLETELGGYDRVILDLPPISDAADDGLSTVAVSPVCDGVLLVCAVGVDRRSEISECVSLLRGAGATLSGIVANEYKYVDPLRSLRKFLPAGLAQ